MVPELTVEESRVLGCLIEKEATTPDSYPLTLNALRNACNQSTSRHPVVEYDEFTIEQALASLRERGLTRTVHSTTNRAAKHRHVLPDALRLDPGETALIAVLMLRGPQTVGELKGRTERQHRFTSLEVVASTLDGLAQRGLVLQLERQPGQKDARWVHLLSSIEPDDGIAVTGGTALRSDATVESGVSSATTVAADADPYGSATAEFYDLLATGHWDEFGLDLLDLLEGVDSGAGPIVDIGAGTGIGVPYLLAAVPDAEIVAIEPSKAMRTAFHARLALDKSLQDRVTVDPRPIDVALPDHASAVVMSAVMGHLSEAERTTLWRFVAERMPPGAPVVIELLPPYRPVEIPAMRYAALPVGRFVYEGWQEGSPASERDMRWTMTYRVLDGDTIVSTQEVTSTYRCWSFDDLRAEVEPFGLSVSELGDIAVVRR